MILIKFFHKHFLWSQTTNNTYLIQLKHTEGPLHNERLKHNFPSKLPAKHLVPKPSSQSFYSIKKPHKTAITLFPIAINKSKPCILKIQNTPESHLSSVSQAPNYSRMTHHLDQLELLAWDGVFNSTWTSAAQSQLHANLWE